MSVADWIRTGALLQAQTHATMHITAVIRDAKARVTGIFAAEYTPASIGLDEIYNTLLYVSPDSQMVVSGDTKR
jgi:hypothetical protein